MIQYFSVLGPIQLYDYLKLLCIVVSYIAICYVVACHDVNIELDMVEGWFTVKVCQD